MFYQPGDLFLTDVRPDYQRTVYNIFPTISRPFHCGTNPNMGGSYSAYSYIQRNRVLSESYPLAVQKKVARNGVLIGRMLYFKLYYEEINEMLVFSLTFNIINYLTAIVPVSFVSFGSIVVELQVTIISERGTKITFFVSKKKSSKENEDKNSITDYKTLLIV